MASKGTLNLLSTLIEELVNLKQDMNTKSKLCKEKIENWHPYRYGENERIQQGSNTKARTSRRSLE